MQQGGNQLEEWNLHRLARDLYRNDLARDSALLSLRGENFRDATIGRFILNQLVSAETHKIPYLLNEWLPAALPIVNFDAVIRLQHSDASKPRRSFTRSCVTEIRAMKGFAPEF